MTTDQLCDLEAELHTTPNIERAIRLAKTALHEAPEYDRALWAETLNLLQLKLHQKGG